MSAPSRKVRDSARSTGRALFVVVMVVAILGVVGAGLAAWADRLSGERVYWGTYTETQCVPDEGPNPHNGLQSACRSEGTWVSDDGSIVKRGIFLDGGVDPGGSVRASYQPGGLMSDAENNIVHTQAFSSAGLWLPFVLAVGFTWMLLDRRRSWRRRSQPVTTANHETAT